MGIRGDLRNTIQTINPHSTPPIGIVTMFFDRLDSGGVSPKGSCQGQAAPTCRRQVSRQTGLNRLVSPPFPLLYPTTTSIWLSCHSV
jgi:hypothetical protein